MESYPQKNEIAVFAGGCFWCTEAIFQKLRGVVSVTPGYAGGELENPDYYKVMRGDTGHAESIKVEFDPSVVSYRDLLEVFFATHDPTTLNRQMYDQGTEYRSLILYTSDAQKQEIEKIIKELTDNHTYADQIVTEVKALDKFYEAEPEHKNFYENNPNSPYCQVIINPKLKKFKEKFAALIKE